MSNRRMTMRKQMDAQEAKAQDSGTAGRATPVEPDSAHQSPTKPGRGASRRPGLGKKTFTNAYEEDTKPSSTALAGGAAGSPALNRLSPESWNNIPLPLVEGVRTIIAELKHI